MQETHKATVMELKRQIQDLQALVDDPTAGDTIRNLTLRVDQARHREVSLQKEAEDLRQAKEDAVVMHKEAVLAHSREAGVVEAKMSALNLDRSSLQRQIEAAEVTQQKLNQKLAEANGRVESLEKTVARLNRQVGACTGDVCLGKHKSRTGERVLTLLRLCSCLCDCSCPRRSAMWRAPTQWPSKSMAKRAQRGRRSVARSSCVTHP